MFLNHGSAYFAPRTSKCSARTHCRLPYIQRINREEYQQLFHAFTFGYCSITDSHGDKARARPAILLYLSRAAKHKQYTGMDVHMEYEPID